jgi:uncharacterized protein
MNEIERRNGRPAELRIVPDGPTHLSGYAAVFNSLSEDLGGFRERISPGAFAESLTSDDIRALFNHDPNFIMGRNRAGTLRLVEDEVGLRIEIDPPDTQACRDLLVSIGRGDVNQMSFGFIVRPNGQTWEKDAEGRVLRTLNSIRLIDVACVTYPAYPETSVAVRCLDAWREPRAAIQSIAVLRRTLDLALL